ncbi:phosphoglycerate kinase [Pseudodesulfovibrio sediminis]|uniref:Phosphoglycerate kinase n=1 Tax=Pseudodesulfovibrio sediminis TaxID=2810563 RepID=A0ABM7P2U3_9BACT|nr:phosphoglycerate kinase [Pseudodesulfovibrio sediminis]BCS87154.1 phosphoglycerate kinase [Pseudodesulfovibrio sediminis]
MLFIDQVDISGKKLLFRVDFNVPLENGVITDDNRIQAAVPTLKYALEKGASIILCAHLGKPKGKVVPGLSLAPVAKRTGELLGLDVVLVEGVLGDAAVQAADALLPGQVIMLDNLRFNPEETGKTVEERGDFGKKLASLAEIYVNDAFGVAHRENASVVDVPKYVQTSCGGFLLKKEQEFLGDALNDPRRPYVCVSGGAKVSTKLGILNNLLGKVDDIIIGGAMANTFMLAKGYEVGKSLVEVDLVDDAKSIIKKAESMGSTLHLPVDYLYAAAPDAQAAEGVCAADAIPSDSMVLDIGPETIENFTAVLERSKTIVWNGPMGMFETEAFAKGSLAVCEAIAGLDDALSIVGGGDTDAVVHLMHLADKFSFISTGGGSFLQFLEGKELPAFKALKEYSNK